MTDQDHLYEDRLIVAVLAEEDLSQDERRHLVECPACAALRDHLAADLAGLEELGQQAVEVPPRRFALPPEPPALPRRRRWPLAAGGSLALAAVALLAVWLGVWGPQGGSAPQPGFLAETVPAPLYEDPATLAGLGLQEVEPFSPFQLFVLGGDQAPASEEFMEFITPDPSRSGGIEGGSA